uniref:DJ-1/PfpI domain-containing protein n=1 Tax=Rhodnius prolixus TaxID=13249 RepID=T1I8Q4_RHOPR
MNHKTKEVVKEKRNVLVEAARIARGEIYDLKEAKAKDFDMLVVPGGYGVAKNLSDLAEGKDVVTVMPEFERLVSEFFIVKKPIGAICISPAVVVFILSNKIGKRGNKIKVTIGDDREKLIEKLDGEHIKCDTELSIEDEEHNVFSCSAYMRSDERETMITPKKIGKTIAKKFKNWKGTTAPKEPSASSSKDFLKEPEENILIVETATEQQTPVTTEISINTTTTESCSNITIEDQNTPIADNIEAIEIVAQEPNTFNDPSPAKPCDAADKGENPKTTHQKQAILAGITGIALLICSIEFYALKIHVTVAVVVGIVGLMCMSFALYKALKPDTKLEKVEQPIVSFESEDMVRNP